MIHYHDFYDRSGRVNGHHVYMLFCTDGLDIYVKVGHASNPYNRLDALRTACPFVPDRFAFVRIYNKQKALQLESALHDAFAAWGIHGEWFAFREADKEEFNARWKRVFADFAKPGWPMKWVQISAKKYIKAKEATRRFMQKRWMQKGRAYQDFTKDLR